MSAPLNGAVVATGVVKVESNRKSLQHLDGGIVKELRVKEGDSCSGDPSVVLPDATPSPRGIGSFHTAISGLRGDLKRGSELR